MSGSPLAVVEALNGWADVWSQCLWRACWQGGAALALVGVLIGLRPRLSPRLRAGLLYLAYLKMLVAFFWATPIDLPLLRPTPTEQTEVASVPSASRPHPLLPWSAGNAPALPQAPVSRPPLSATTWLLGLWTVGVAFMIRERIRERCAAAFLKRNSIALMDSEWNACCADLCKAAGIRRAPGLLLSLSGQGPLVLGITHPVILLPASMLNAFGPDRMRLVLAHELAHIRRRDLLHNGLPALVHTLFFFHPAVWLANREWRLTQELACDEDAMALTETAVDIYAEALVSAIRLTRDTRSRNAVQMATVGISDSPRTLKRRLLAMHHIQPLSRRSWIVASTALGVIAVLGILPWRVVAQGAKETRILFASNRVDREKFNIYSMRSDGSDPVNLTHSDALEFDPIWSPDHSRIAFAVFDTQAKSADIYVMNADGSRRTRLTQASTMTFACGPSWSPDGTRIAYGMMKAPGSGEAGPLYEIYLMDANGGNRKRFGEGLLPIWSPDGKQLAYTLLRSVAQGPDSASLHIADLDGSHSRKVVDNGLAGSWTTDRLYFTRVVNQGSSSTVHSIKSDGSDPKALTQISDHLLGPLVSADGKQIFCTRFVESEGVGGAAKMRVYVMGADGANVRPLTEDSSTSLLGGGTGVAFVITNMERLAR